MVICKFYQQGTCKFGENCKFEHSVGDPYHYHNPNLQQNSTSILRQPTFGATQNVFGATAAKTAPPQNVDTSTLVKTVSNEMKAVEIGRQWLLSCYAPFKEKPAFPGFEDTSFEEVRLGFYEAQKNGTLEQYKLQIQEMYQTVLQKVKALQNPSPEITEILKNIYNTPPASSTSNQNNIFATVAQNRTGGFNSTTTNTANVFGGSSSIFGGNATFNQNQNTTSTSIFGQSKPAFGAQTTAPTSSIFGGTSSSVFGGNSNTSAVFGEQKPGASIFGTQPSSSVFGGNATSVFQQGTPNVFGGQGNTNSAFGGAPTFGTTPQSNPSFNASTGSATANIFGAAAQNQTFAGTSTNIFAQTVQNQGISPNFGNAQNQGGIFSQAAQNLNQAPSNSVFGSGNSNVFGNAASQSVFGNSAAQNQPANSGNSIFGTPPPNATVFTQNAPGFSSVPVQNVSSQQSNTPFVPVATNATSPSSIFGGFVNNSIPEQSTFSSLAQPAVGGSSNYTQSIFGGTATASKPAVDVDPTIYSKLEELTTEEIKWFESDELENIPLNPPTLQMCMKV